VSTGTVPEFLRGWLAEDAEGAQLTGEDLGDSRLGRLRAHSITYRIAG